MSHELINLVENGSVTTPKGFLAAGVTAGIKESGRPDLAVLYCETPARFAAAFTRNDFAAAPVLYCRQLAASVEFVRACVFNSGNANACTGRQGLTDTKDTARELAERLDIATDEVLVFSTGRIGVPLPMDKVREGIRAACKTLSSEGGAPVAEAIMTTDTKPKSLAVKLDIDGVPVHVGGMAKGAGMIAPNLAVAKPQATLLACITTDARLEPGVLDTAFAHSLDSSFNRITVDGDTSTNDSFLALANGLAGNPPVRPGTVEAEQFQGAFCQVAAELARQLVRDGEGATRFVELRVTGARSGLEAETCAKAIANSLLCTTAWFGGDPNWGRILDAAGYAGVKLVPSEVSLYFEGKAVVRGGVSAGVPEAELAKLVDQNELHIDLDLGHGAGEYTVWTCDLSYEYVKINAEYHT